MDVGNYQTLGTPGIIYYNNLLHCYFTDNNHIIQHITSSDQGQNWSKAQPTGLQSNGGTCAVVFNSQIYLFFADPNGNGLFWAVSSDPQNFSSQGYLGINVDETASAAVLNKTLCVVCKDGGRKGIMFATTSGDGNWVTGHPDLTTNGAPSIIAYHGIFHVYFRDGNADDKGILHVTSSDGVNFQAAPNWNLGFNTNAGPCAVVANDMVFIYWRDGQGNGILSIYSYDGYNFSATSDWYTRVNTAIQPAAVSVNNIIYLAIRSDPDGYLLFNIPPVNQFLPKWMGTMKGWDYILPLQVNIYLAIAASKIPPWNNTVTAPDGTQVGVSITFQSITLQPGPRASTTYGTFVLGGTAQLKDQTYNLNNWSVDVTAELNISSTSGSSYTISVSLSNAQYTINPDPQTPPDVVADITFGVQATFQSEAQFSLPSFNIGDDWKGFLPQHLEVLWTQDKPSTLLIVGTISPTPPTDPNCRIFNTADVLTSPNLAAFHVSNFALVSMVTSVTQSKLRDTMGQQDRPLTYQIQSYAGRTRGYTDGNYCNFLNMDYTPSVDWSWVDAYDNAIHLDLRVRAVPVDNTAVYLESIPALTPILSADKKTISLFVCDLGTSVAVNGPWWQWFLPFILGQIINDIIISKTSSKSIGWEIAAQLGSLQLSLPPGIPVQFSIVNISSNGDLTAEIQIAF